jgi:hypothetical protein
MEGIDAGVLLKTFGPILAGYATAMLLLVKVIERLVPNKWERVLEKMALQTADLHEAHLGDPAHDPDGRLKWWFPQDLAKTLRALIKGQEAVVSELRSLNAKWDVGEVGEMVGQAQLTQAQALEKIANAFVASSRPKDSGEAGG